jgi:hypothetical protein
LELSWYENEFDTDSNRNISIAYPISNWLLISREDLVEDNKTENSEDGIEIANCADFFLINYADRSAEGFAGDNEIGGGENSVETVDYADFFFVNHIDRSAEGFARDNKVGDGENGIEIANYAGFFFANHIDRGIEDFVRDGENNIKTADYVGSFLVNHINRGAVSPHSANLVIAIDTAKTANIYWSWAYRINSGSFFNSYSWKIMILLIISSNSISYSKKTLNR